jgi:hypothetical protein
MSKRGVATIASGLRTQRHRIVQSCQTDMPNAVFWRLERLAAKRQKL